MKKRGTQGGVVVSAVVCLLCAVALLLYSRTGQTGVSDLLDAMASNGRFVQYTLAIEAGTPLSRLENAQISQASGTAQQPLLEAETAQDGTAVGIWSDQTAAAETSVESNGGISITQIFDGIAAENAFAEGVLEAVAPLTTVHTLALNNESGYEVDAQAMLENPVEISLADEGVQVVIYHTHTTEAYRADGAHTYAPLSDARTLDTSQSVVRVGAVITEVLESYGISVMHVTDVFDYPSYDGAYAASQAALEQIVADNPSVSVTLDVHRDAIIDDDGNHVSTTVTYNGTEIAPLMLVVGTDASGLLHDGWMDNFNFACQLQNDMMNAAPEVMRALNLRRQRFNQHVTAGSLLLEVGWSGNTLQQAMDAAELFAHTLAQRLKAGATAGAIEN